MERTLSVEEKIKRAEEISARRKGIIAKKTTTVNLNNENKKDIKLLKKMLIQMTVCSLIYFFIYIVQSSNNIFAQNCIDKINEFLSYDTSLNHFYESVKNYINNYQTSLNSEKKEENIINNNDAIIIQQDNNNENNVVDNYTQEEIDIQNIKNSVNFIKPIEGTITSKFGQREPTTSTVPKNHTGIDIAAIVGTKIKSATEGEVVLVSEEGDYGKHIKIQNGEVSILYAHCNNIYVKQGEQIKQGQEIAEVGSTGNSTGAHLHFEIRICERTVNPEKILEF